MFPGSRERHLRYKLIDNGMCWKSLDMVEGKYVQAGVYKPPLVNFLIVGFWFFQKSHNVNFMWNRLNKNLTYKLRFFRAHYHYVSYLCGFTLINRWDPKVPKTLASSTLVVIRLIILLSKVKLLRVAHQTEVPLLALPLLLRRRRRWCRQSSRRRRGRSSSSACEAIPLLKELYVLAAPRNRHTRRGSSKVISINAVKVKSKVSGGSRHCVYV